MAQSGTLARSGKPQALVDLYNLLIAPIETNLPKDSGESITLILQDSLFLVPFGALVRPDGDFLIDRYTLASAPSIGALDLTNRALTASAATKGVLIVGNPSMPTFVKPNGAPEILPPLPGSEKEARTIAARFNAVPLIGPQATKEAVLSRISVARIIHFATHGFVDVQTRGYQSWLALSPTKIDSGFLTAREIAGLQLHADLVTLSACDTALGTISSDGILGLSRSFFAAGVPTVVVSLWELSDESTAYLMEHFYHRIQDGETKAGSLRGAMLDTRKVYNAPLDWAAFVLVGEGGVANITNAADVVQPVSPAQVANVSSPFRSRRVRGTFVKIPTRSWPELPTPNSSPV